MKTRKTARTVLAATVMMAAVILVIWLTASPYAGDHADFRVARDSRPFGLYSPGTVEEMPPESARLLIEKLGLASIPDYQDYTLGLIEELGVTWVRLDFLYDGSGFIVPEEYMAKLQANGIEVIACPRAFMPVEKQDLPAYEERLGELVANNPSITVWQIDNEPNIGTADTSVYLDLFFAGSRAVSNACPDCRIALAGVPALDPGRQESLDYYDRLLGAIAEHSRGGEPPFDIFDIHYYGLAGQSEELLAVRDEYQELLRRHGLDAGVSFWMSECATYSGKPSIPPDLPEQSEQQQAGELVARFVTMLGAGAERVAWARFYENLDYAGVAGGYYDHTALIYNGLGAEAQQGIAAGTRKAAFEAFGLLTFELNGYTGVERIAPGQYRFDFSDGREPVFVVWAAGDTTVADELTGAVSITSLDGVTYDSLGLKLGEEPVFVIKH